ncbi:MULTISPECIES: TonB-dependent siderophore receptor [Oxalobacteraceae]|uniref:TonB-dependent siderophore receptor n=1 Tax=Herminiimonas sp. Marseille-P9896 TaxID=2742211 RepID=UPI0020CA5882|nr:MULTISPECIES: TonB-dependent siderophore receptor [Oxalobacteraceae]
MQSRLSRLSRHHDTINAATPPMVRPLMLAIHLAFAGLALSPAFSVAHAQQAASTSKSYNIPAGPLSTVLSRFIGESGIYLSGTSELAQGKTSPGLQGNFSAQAGLAALLVGTGLEGVNTSNNEYVLRKSTNANSDAVLPAVIVKSAYDETASGPVKGYVAKRSATGSKTDTLLIEIPQSISIITADEIGDRKAESLDEALRYTAGVTPNLKPWAVDEFSKLRGFPLGTAGIFLDGLLTSGRAYAAPIEPYGLERLEVLRGPASVLYGQTPPGGMVNAVSKRPTAEAIREIGVEYGTYDRKQIKADIGGMFNGDPEWTYRVTMLARESATRLAFDKDNRFFIAPAITWKPNAATKLTLMANYQKDDQAYSWPNQLQNPGALGQVDPKVNIGGLDNRWKRDNRMVGYEFEHRFNDTWSVQQNFRYSEFDRDETNVFPMVLQPDGRTLTRRFSPRESHWKGLLLDTRVQGRLKSGAIEHNVLVGVDYAKSRTTNEYIYDTPNIQSIDLFNPVYTGQQTITRASNPEIQRIPSSQTGLYIQDQMKFDRWVVTGGLRHDKAETTGNRIFPASGTSVIAYDQSASATTGRLGAVYLFDSGWAPYISYASSFSPEIGNDVYGNVLKPSTGKQFEAGVKYQPVGQRVSYTASVFNLVRRNVSTPAPQDRREVVQTGEVTSRGLELETRAELNRNISLIAQYTYLDTEVTKSNDKDLGLRQQGAPKHSASIWGKYNFNLGSSVKAYSALGIRYLGKARSDADDNNLNISNQSFALMDAALGFDQGQWRFSINVNNLLDKQFLTDCNGTFCYRNAERTINVSSIYRF